MQHPLNCVARSLPLSILHRHRNNPVQVEALLMGQAGFLGKEVCFPVIMTLLTKEYLYLRKKIQPETH